MPSSTAAPKSLLQQHNQNLAIEEVELRTGKTQRLLFSSAEARQDADLYGPDLRWGLQGISRWSRACANKRNELLNGYGLTLVVGFVGDELISDSYNMKESDDGFFYEVEGKVGAVTSSCWCNR
jgi:hypothetical protein